MTSNNTNPIDKGFATPTASWFKSTITLEEIPKPALDLLMSCTGLPLDKVVPHVNEARDKAWTAAPYPCVGMFMFLELNMSRHPLYPQILSRLRNNEMTSRLLDVGCGLGQDERKLNFDGVPAGRVYAVELEAGLISAGFDLFMDSAGEEISFLQGDAVKDEASQWMKKFKVEDGFEIVHTGALFHLFDWEKQLVIARKLVEVVQGKDDAVIFGWAFAAHDAGLRSLGPNKEAQVFGHNEKTVRRFWKEIGEVSGTSWSLELRFEWMEPNKSAGLAKDGKWGDAEGNGLMWFSVHKV